MLLEENKAIIRRLFKAENEGNLAIYDELMSPDYVDNAFQFTSLEEYKKMHAKTREALPDFQETIEDMVAEGEKVVVRFKGTGTHKGEWFGIPPTGKKITITGVLIYRIVDGKIVEKVSGIYDFLDFYNRIGIIEYTEKGKKLFPEEAT